MHGINGMDGKRGVNGAETMGTQRSDRGHRPGKCAYSYLPLKLHVDASLKKNFVACN